LLRSGEGGIRLSLLGRRDFCHGRAPIGDQERVLCFCFW
jgi:hypothetical protein